MAVTLRIVIHRTKARDAVDFAHAQYRKIDVRRFNVGGTFPRLKPGSLAEFKHIAAGHLPKNRSRPARQTPPPLGAVHKTAFAPH